jgi:hypothetical protein
MSRSIEEILANIDSATPTELAMVADGSFTGEEKGAVQDEVATVATPAASGDATPQPAETQNAEVAPIQTRDGKHTIPYEVLASTRAAKEAAEAARADLQTKLDALQAKVNASAANPAANAPPESTITPEELAEMQENFPVMAKAYQAMQANLDRLQQAATVQQAATQQSEASSVQDLIDANPKLAYLQASDPAAWKRAIALDDQLRNDPTTSHLPMADRFTKVAAMYEVIHGAINAPVVTAPVIKPAVSIDAVLAKANQTAAPHSLSDLPGGSAVATSEVGNLENMSGAEIGSNLMSMSSKAREAYLNSLG